MSHICLAIDCMGGDFGPPVSVRAAVTALQSYPDIRLMLFGIESEINAELPELNDELSSRLQVVHCDQVVAMDEKPSVALRTKRTSSMCQALVAVQQGDANACVSAGNTGALMAFSRFVVKMLPGIDRPAIITAIPTASGQTYLLDLGANVECDSETLFQFGIMGSELAAAVTKIKAPRVGLLNIGEEEIKGNDQIKQAAQLLSNCPGVDYVGFVEGDQIFSGQCDVVVTDGFTGNNVLKASEGIVRLLVDKLRSNFQKNIFTKLVGLLIRPILKSFRKEIDPEQFNGATFIGLQGIVVKSHGSASVKATVFAIEQAIKEVEQKVPQRIAARVEELVTARI